MKSLLTRSPRAISEHARRCAGRVVLPAQAFSSAPMSGFRFYKENPVRAGDTIRGYLLGTAIFPDINSSRLATISANASGGQKKSSEGPDDSQVTPAHSSDTANVSDAFRQLEYPPLDNLTPRRSPNSRGVFFVPAHFAGSSFNEITVTRGACWAYATSAGQRPAKASRDNCPAGSRN
jgi:hypothetical protein